VIKIFKTEFAYKVEGTIHRLWKHKQYNYDNFTYLEGEWFYLNLNDVDNFIPLCEQIENNIKIISNPMKNL
jgi:hypothetical protein